MVRFLLRCAASVSGAMNAVMAYVAADDLLTGHHDVVGVAFIGACAVAGVVTSLFAFPDRDAA